MRRRKQQKLSAKQKQKLILQSAREKQTLIHHYAKETSDLLEEYRKLERALGPTPPSPEVLLKGALEEVMVFCWKNKIKFPQNLRSQIDAAIAAAERN